jgi:SAM-dependent methyltransferase
MKNESIWQPTKFEIVNGDLRPSLDEHDGTGMRSFLVGRLQASAYQYAIEHYAHGRLVDLGCGKVPLYGIYRSRVTDVLCIDWPDSLHGAKHIDIQTDLNCGIPIPDGTVDTALVTDVLEHLRDPFLFWREIARVLAPRGLVIVGVPFLYWLHEQPYDYFRYTRHRLEAFCNDNNLKVLELKAYGGALAVILDIIGKSLPRPWLWRPFIRAALLLYSTRLGQRIDKRDKEAFPIGYLLVARKYCDPSVSNSQSSGG